MDDGAGHRDKSVRHGSEFPPSRDDSNLKEGGYDGANRGREKQGARHRILRTLYKPKKKPTESAGKYIGLPYTQHNPEVPKNGPEGFIQFIEGMFKKHPDLNVVIHRAVADENFVALHVHLKRDESDSGIAVAEFFRVENGKIVEHWDVMQSVPKKTASGNSMF